MEQKLLIIESEIIGKNKFIKQIRLDNRILFSENFYDIVDEIKSNKINYILLSDFRGYESTINCIRFIGLINIFIKLIVLISENSTKEIKEKYIKAGASVITDNTEEIKGYIKSILNK